MTDTFRAMCAELNFIWGRSTNPDDLFENMIPLIDRARALLAQPVAEGPTDEELEKLAREWDSGFGSIELRFAAYYARAVLARWGRPTPQPPAEGEVAEMQRWGVNHGAQPGRPLLSPMEDGYWTPWHIAADLLQRLASDNAGLEAAAESAYLDNLSLLDSQND